MLSLHLSLFSTVSDTSQLPLLASDMLAVATSAEDFNSLLSGLDNKMRQWSTSIGTEKTTKDLLIPDSVGTFLKGASDYHDICCKERPLPPILITKPGSTPTLKESGWKNVRHQASIVPFPAH